MLLRGTAALQPFLGGVADSAENVGLFLFAAVSLLTLGDKRRRSAWVICRVDDFAFNVS